MLKMGRQSMQQREKQWHNDETGTAMQAAATGVQSHMRAMHLWLITMSATGLTPTALSAATSATSSSRLPYALFRLYNCPGSMYSDRLRQRQAGSAAASSAAAASAAAGRQAGREVAAGVPSSRLLLLLLQRRRRRLQREYRLAASASVACAAACALAAPQTQACCSPGCTVLHSCA